MSSSPALVVAVSLDGGRDRRAEVEGGNTVNARRRHGRGAVRVGQIDAGAQGDRAGSCVTS
ncbi:hypothetical protein [Paractinoplanes hotanensis]|uniref:Uncharacterized protein n=1 Tax=Paractinoplanes hotanensis TaxID=2906497 RepID=A0ABT0XWE3_9ACTN|nr:hypothetical protein [Actinoplanes hotanensis]MCM4078111.1 hypothetical protein [Actinoplanes hotanensis]